MLAWRNYAAKYLLRRVAKGWKLVLASMVLIGYQIAGGTQFQDNGSPVRNSTQEKAQTADLFKHNCARCHGMDGRGQTFLGKTVDAPDFTDPEWWARRPKDRSLAAGITDGLNDMPAFGKKLSKEEIDSLVTYVQHFKDKKSQ
jgi:mono/diheme cytochrome c family protein